MSSPRSLPRRIDFTSVRDAADLGRRLTQFADDVLEWLRTWPAMEMVTFTTHGDYPVYVSTNVQRPRGVVRIHSRPAPGGPSLTEAGIAWRASDDSSRPGIVVDDVEGVVAGTNYEITVLVVGEQVS